MVYPNIFSAVVFYKNLNSYKEPDLRCSFDNFLTRVFFDLAKKI